MNLIKWIHNNINCQPYDYTKAVLSRKSTPEYYLTYSLSENNRDKCKKILEEKRGNVAAVFNLKKKGQFPKTFMGFSVINGDLHDIRFLDKGPGNIVGLSAKADAKRNKNGFVIYKGDKDLDYLEDNHLLKDPVHTTPRKVSFDAHTKTISFSKRNIKREINKFIKSRRPILSKGNPKLDKGVQYGYHTYGISLAPARTNGHANLCSHATPGCLSSCLYTSGNMISMKNKINGRLIRSWIFIFEREYFFERLKKDLLSSYVKCRKDRMEMGVRLNVFSDIPYERIAI